MLLRRFPTPQKLNFNSQKISSPKVLNQFAPAGRVIRRNTYVESRFANKKGQFSKNIKQLEKEIEKVNLNKETIGVEGKGKTRMTFTNCSLLQAAHAQTTTDSKLLMTQKKSVLWEEPALGSPGIEEEAKDLKPVIVYCSCGRISKKGLGLCDECCLLERPQEISGFLYVEKDEKNVDRYWFSLVNTDLYCNCIK